MPHEGPPQYLVPQKPQDELARIREQQGKSQSAEDLLRRVYLDAQEAKAKAEAARAVNVQPEASQAPTATVYKFEIDILKHHRVFGIKALNLTKKEEEEARELLRGMDLDGPDPFNSRFTFFREEDGTLNHHVTWTFPEEAFGSSTNKVGASVAAPTPTPALCAGDDTGERPMSDQEDKTSPEYRQAFQRRAKKRLIQLSLVPNLAPAANAAIRTRLFNTGTGQREIFPEYTKMVSWHKSLEVLFKGEELRTEERILWMQLCKLAAQNEKFSVSCSVGSLLKSLKKTDTGKNRKDLNKQLQRLFEGKIRVTLGDIEYFGSIIPEFAIDKKTKLIKANLSETISRLLGIYDFTMINMDVHLELPGDLVKWLHPFLRSHQGPEVYTSWEEIKGLAGSGTQDLETFKHNFRKAAIKPLKAIGFITDVKSKKGQLIFTIDKKKG